MLIEVRPVRRLRGDQPVDLVSALAPVIDALVADETVDLSGLRLVGDWIQYQRNFRDVVEVRPVLGGAGECRIEVAVDLRRAPGADLATLTKAALSGQAAADRVYLEDWVPGRQSCIWRFNEIYWQFLSLWEAATGADYEQALPGGESDARNQGAVRELISELFATWDGLDARRALPEDLCVVELGVGNGNFAEAFFREFSALDRAHGREYLRRLHYFMGDYSPHFLARAQEAVADYAAHTSAMVLDARRPGSTLGFLRGKVFCVYLSNVYDNLPTDELANIDGRPYLVETRAYLPHDDAIRIAASVGAEPGRLGSLVGRLLTLGPELLAEASGEQFQNTDSAVAFWQHTWEALRLEERYAPLEGLASYRPATQLSGDLLRPFLDAGGPIRMHVSNGALTSLSETLPLLHPTGRMRCHDLFTIDHREYREGFRGPGKYDGSVVNWVNGPVLAHVGARLGYDLAFEPFTHRARSSIKTMTAQPRD